MALKKNAHPPTAHAPTHINHDTEHLLQGHTYQQYNKAQATTTQHNTSATLYTDHPTDPICIYALLRSDKD